MTYQKLLDDFKKVDRDHKPTFFEIINQSDKENTISDVLAFFLNPYKPHNLDTLFIQSLFTCLKISNDFIESETVTVVREHVFSNQKRLDLLIEMDTCVIGIENKVYAGDYNDLKYYSIGLKNIAQHKKEIRVLLTAYPRHGHSGFINITYTEYAKAIEVNYLKEKKSADLEYSKLYQDIIQNMKREGKGMTDDLYDFFLFKNNYLNSVELNKKAQLFRVEYLKLFWDMFYERFQERCMSTNEWTEVFRTDFYNKSKDYACIGACHVSGLFDFYLEPPTFYKGHVAWGFTISKSNRGNQSLMSNLTTILESIFEELKIEKKDNNWLCNRKLSGFNLDSPKFLDSIIKDREKKIDSFLDKFQYITEEIISSKEAFDNLKKELPK